MRLLECLQRFILLGWQNYCCTTPITIQIYFPIYSFIFAGIVICIDVIKQFVNKVSHISHNTCTLFFFSCVSLYYNVCGHSIRSNCFSACTIQNHKFPKCYCRNTIINYWLFGMIFTVTKSILVWKSYILAHCIPFIFGLYTNHFNP